VIGISDSVYWLANCRTIIDALYLSSLSPRSLAYQSSRLLFYYYQSDLSPSCIVSRVTAYQVLVVFIFSKDLVTSTSSERPTHGGIFGGLPTYIPIQLHNPFFEIANLLFKVVLLLLFVYLPLPACVFRVSK